MIDPSAPTDSPPLVSDKNRKDEILAAYQDLLKRYEQRAAQSRGREQEVKRAEEQAVVSRASGYTQEKILQGCRNLEGVIRTHLVDMSEKLIAESKKLEEMQEAIRISEQRLKDVHDIEVAAETLSELITSCNAKQKETEEVSKQRLGEIDSEVQKKKLEWKREEEEHTYILAQQVRREAREHEDRRVTFERELSERKALLEKETLALKDASERAKMFDTESASMKKRTQEETEQRVRQEEKIRSDLHEQEVLRRQGIAELTIETLTQNVKSMEKEIDMLRKQLDQAHRENKEIALRVIEGTSGSVSLRNLQRMAATERE